MSGSQGSLLIPQYTQGPTNLLNIKPDPGYWGQPLPKPAPAPVQPASGGGSGNQQITYNAGTGFGGGPLRDPGTQVTPANLMQVLAANGGTPQDNPWAVYSAFGGTPAYVDVQGRPMMGGGGFGGGLIGWGGQGAEAGAVGGASGNQAGAGVGTADVGGVGGNAAAAAGGAQSNAEDENK
jgi:hypothetical protein